MYILYAGSSSRMHEYTWSKGRYIQVHVLLVGSIDSNGLWHNHSKVQINMQVTEKRIAATHGRMSECRHEGWSGTCWTRTPYVRGQMVYEEPTSIALPLAQTPVSPFRVSSAFMSYLSKCASNTLHRCCACESYCLTHTHHVWSHTLNIQ